MKWGFGCDTTRDVFQWFKLWQDPRYKAEPLEEAYPDRTVKVEDEKHAKGLITQYLKYLRRHVEKSVEDKLDLGDKTRWEYVVTVPAMWPESAQITTDKCATDAGMAKHCPVKIVAEQEAAGIYALSKMSRDMELKVGAIFVICDAGGAWVHSHHSYLKRLNANL